MANGETVAIAVDLDVGEAETGVKDIVKALNSLNGISKEIGKSIAKAFDPMLISLERLQYGIYQLTEVLINVTNTIKDLMDQLSIENIAEQVLGWGSAIVEMGSFGLNLATDAGEIGTTVTGIGSTIAAAFGAIKTAFTTAAGALGISVGWLVALIALVAAAIVALIVCWDDIVKFYTEDLPFLWNNLPEILEQLVGQIPEPFRSVVEEIIGLFTDCWNGIAGIFNGIVQWVQTNMIQPLLAFLEPIRTWFSEVFEGIQQTVSDVVYNVSVLIEGFEATIQRTVVVVCEKIVSKIRELREKVKSLFSKVADYFGGIFADAWAKVVGIFSVEGTPFGDFTDGVLTSFKKIVNDLICGINSVVKKPFDSLNSTIEKLRSANILGITPFSELKTINVPQIPYLAKGAVLPANRPFLAVVGDQRHGTNVEAPLATIQEAVALVMDDHIAAMMAGFEALLAEQRATRQTIEGIEIGDTVIGKAAERYRGKMAVVRGGAY